MRNKTHALVALAALALLGTGAQAQSNVTVYGKLDLGYGKPIGTDQDQMLDAAGSRLGFRGTEDLGGGLRALFGLEHRFNPDTGLPNAIFWHGYSTVGLSGAFGRVNLGRQYTPAFSLIQNQIDPWGGDTIAQLRDVAMRVGGVGKVRVAKSIRYDWSGGGFNVAASIAQAEQAGSAAGPDRPISIAANYGNGPFFIGAGYEDPANQHDDQWSVGARYALGPVTLSAGYSWGNTAADKDTKGFLVGALWRVGTGELMAGYANHKVDGKTLNSKASVGYHHWLSKRTKLYADLSRDGKAASEKSGWDLGLQHNF